MCVTVTHVDGLVLARSVFEHGVNYRSAMIHGVPRKVTDPDEKLAGLRRLTEHATPGQWSYARQPTRKELAATVLLALPLDEASVKIRTGGPDDGDGPDAELGLWAGTLPLTSVWGAPVPDPVLPLAPRYPTTSPTERHQTRADQAGPMALPRRCGPVPPEAAAPTPPTLTPSGARGTARPATTHPHPADNPSPHPQRTRTRTPQTTQTAPHRPRSDPQPPGAYREESYA